jgi:hypothetical protein
VVGAAGRRDWPVTAERYRFRLAAVVYADARETVARDEVQASVGAPSETLPLLHPCKGSSDRLTTPIHASEQPRSRPTCRRTRYRYRLQGAVSRHEGAERCHSSKEQ